MFQVCAVLMKLYYTFLVMFFFYLPHSSSLSRRASHTHTSLYVYDAHLLNYSYSLDGSEVVLWCARFAGKLLYICLRVWAGIVLCIYTENIKILSLDFFPFRISYIYTCTVLVCFLFIFEG